MVLKSYAKINLLLKINRKLTNGLHDIQSIFCLVTLFDTIDIRRIKNKFKDEIYFKGPYSKHVKESNNSIKKILIIMRKRKLISDYYRINVFKKIPVFAGLGGGTSNAATIFKFLVKKKINKKDLDKIVDYIGSDFRLFLQRQGFLKNLKSVIPFNKKYKFYFLIVYPKIKCSTKKIYSRVKTFSIKDILPLNKLKNWNFLLNYITYSNNDLQLIVEKKYPIIGKLLFDISIEKGCYFSKMTGSGSACYGLFINEKSSKAALKSLRKKYPKFWFSIAKTI